MDTGVLKAGPQNVMLNIIQSEDLSINMADFLFPWASEGAPQFFDGFDARVTTQDQFDGPGIIGVDIKGELLIAGQPVRIYLLESFEISIQFRFLILEPLIIHSTIFHMILQEFPIQTVAYFGAGPTWAHQND